MERTMRNKHFAARRKARGAAMVEAGILAPIFAMMMMMTVYLGGVYEAKYKTVMDARFKTWNNASNNCDPEGSSESAGSYDTPSEAGDGAGKNVDGDSSSGASSSWGISHGKVERTWDYEPTYKFNNGGPKTVSTESWAMCNNRKYGKNVFSYMWQAIKGFL